MKSMFIAAACAAMVLCFAPSAMAQECNPEVAHAHLATSGEMCGSDGLIHCTESCVCDGGFHPRDRGAAPSGSNPCVRNEPSWGSYADPICGFGAVRNARGDCECGPELGARRARSIAMLPLDFVRDLATRGLAEDPSELIREARLERMRTIAVHVCSDPLATGGAPGTVARTIGDAYLESLRILCAAPEAATDEQLIAACTQTRALIDSIYPRTTITWGDGANRRDYSFPEFVTLVLAPLFAQIREDIDGLRALLGEDDGRGPVIPRVHALEDRVDALEEREDMGRTILSLMHLRIGAFGMIGGMLPGPATGAGGVSLELLFRFGDLPVGSYGRLHFGGQSTGWNTGESMYVSGGGGFTFFTGGRDDTTLSIGYFGETLVDPYMANDVFPHDSVGVAHGAEIGVSLPIPGASWLRVRGSLFGAWAERRLLDDQGVYMTPQAFYLGATLGLEAQVPGS